jgi:transposase
VLVLSNRLFSARRGAKEEFLKKYLVRLTGDERARLEAMVRGGRDSVRRVKRALILLAVNAGHRDEDIAAEVRVHRTTVEHIRKRFAEEGLEAALNERPRPGRARMLDGRQEAYVIALACSDPPEGRAKWTLRLLANRLVELEIVDEISHHTVDRLLKRGSLNPGSASSGALPR